MFNTLIPHNTKIKIIPIKKITEQAIVTPYFLSAQDSTIPIGANNQSITNTTINNNFNITNLILPIVTIKLPIGNQCLRRLLQLMLRI